MEIWLPCDVSNYRIISWHIYLTNSIVGVVFTNLDNYGAQPSSHQKKVNIMVNWGCFNDFQPSKSELTSSQMGTWELSKG